MSRVFLTIVLPLLLPTAVYLAWCLMQRGGETGGGLGRWIWLAIAGLALASLTLVVVSVGFSGAGNGTYIAPHVDDGRIVPGHIVRGPQ